MFESPHRIAATVTELAERLGADRQAAVARELTKRFEEVLRGTPGELGAGLSSRAATGLKGEFVLVLAGAQIPPSQLSVDQLAQLVVDRAAAGQRLKAAAKEVGPAPAVPANQPFEAALRLREAAEA